MLTEVRNKVIQMLKKRKSLQDIIASQSTSKYEEYFIEVIVCIFDFAQDLVLFSTIF